MVEFAFLMPILVGMLLLLIQVEIAISTAIVNQKYARQHLHFLLFNNRFYPEPAFLALNSGRFMQRWWVGVDDNINFNRPEPVPHAPTRKIGRGKLPEDDNQDNPSRRQNVRVRESAFICTAPFGVNISQPFSEGNLGEETFAAGNFHYCEQ